MLAARGKALAFAAIALLAGTLTTQGASAAIQPHQGGTLNVGFPSDTKTLDPIYSIQFTERQVLYLIYNTLVKLDTDFSIKPELATSWDVRDGGLRVVFKLRHGVQFQDGTKFDASVVKWNIDQRLDPKVASPQRKQLASVIDSVDVLGPYTVEFKLKQPFPGLLGMLGQRAGFMVSPTAWKKWGKDFGSHPVGTGPFVFKEWTRGSRIVLERNPHYWQKGLPHLDKIVFHDIADSVVGVQRLLTGELDYVGQLSPNDIRPIEGNHNIELLPITVGRWYSLQWQVDKPPFNNAKLRQAISCALDRNRINEIVMDGKGTVADGPTPPGLWWYDPHIKVCDHDIAKAKKLLAEAGYPNGIKIDLSAPQVSVLQQLVQLVQEELGEAGIKVTLVPVASGEWYSRVVKRATNFTPMRWTQRPDPDGLLYILFDSKGYANTTDYHSKVVDKLLAEARKVTDQSKRKALYWKAQAQMMRDLPYVPLFFSVEYGAIRKNVHGFKWIPDQIPRFRDLWKK